MISLHFSLYSGRLNESQSFFKLPRLEGGDFVPRFFTSNLTELFRNNQTLIDIAERQV